MMAHPVGSQARIYADKQHSRRGINTSRQRHAMTTYLIASRAPKGAQLACRVVWRDTDEKMNPRWDEGLIYDAGMHRGEDAEFYLKKGFRVVGIEALAQTATSRATGCAATYEAQARHLESGDRE